MPRRRAQQPENDLGMEPDEVESFHNAREQNLREKASKSKAARFGYRDDDNGMSDEEVMAIKRASDAESDDEEFYGGVENDGKDEELDWGTKRDTYYGADEAGNEEDAKMEEEEALRLQKKHLSSMKKSDFFEEDDFKEWEKSAKENENATAHELEDGEDESVRRVLESLPTQDPSKLSDKDRKQLLETLYPEATPLAEEFTSLSQILQELKKVIREKQEKSAQSTEDKINLIKHAALSAYLGTLNTYFALFIVNVSGEEKINLKEHPVMEGILQGRQLWNSVKGLKVVGEDDDEESEDSEMSSDEQTTFSDKEGDEVSSEDEADIFDTDALVKSAKKVRRKKEEKSNKDDSESDFGEDFTGFYDNDDDSDEEVAGSSEELVEENEEEEERGSDYDSDLELEFPMVEDRKVNKTKAKKHNPADDYGESAIINDADLDDKLQRKRNLRYYTSKIDQAAKKTRSKLTGDSDLPYRERLAERERRLAEQARLRGLKSEKGDDEAERFSDNDDEGGEDNQHKIKKSKKQSKEEDEADAYYHEVKKQAEERKQSRREAHAKAEKAAKQGKLGKMLNDENLDEEGKRALTFQILKNKGISSGKKKKEKRNSRVNKRAKYEKAQKKLKSVRRVYEQATSSYSGEQTGIKKNISRSVKFSS
ncbi:uncharacterized protein SAPINGB_P002746 [Magnusiomyces paraingens]|uniref:Sas10 C-terminal domain-containing protein n=1 Tax=Magnusiomyces paraingens TaxID=2606893 RepID=A0A5E8BFJ1_9ASCO|nr:uncharacterized protein SAPINGB_P002746 [Saprochaete ingens]VVT50404.1 unnamed protein product [Saprochaete ingens]